MTVLARIIDNHQFGLLTVSLVIIALVAIADHLAPLMVFSRKLILVRRFVHETFEDGQKWCR
jgi:hypothetical protein